MLETTDQRKTRRGYLKYLAAVAVVAGAAAVGAYQFTYSRKQTTPTPTVTLTSTTSTPIYTPTHTPTPTKPVAFYKTRLHITTTSDWSYVRLTSGAKVILSGIVQVNGGFPRKGSDRATLLTQTIGAALRGEQVGVTVDFALTNLSDQVEFEIARGDLGETVVEVWNANGMVPVKIKTVHWSGIAPPSNMFLFTVNAADLISGGPLISGLNEIDDAEFYLFRTLDKDLPELQLQFYRARITFTSTSDWASVSIAHGGEVSDVRLVDTVGNPTRAEVNRIEFSLEQPLKQAKAGARVGLVADVILSNVTGDEPIEFVISKGHLNSAIVEVCNYNADTPILIKRVTHSGISSVADPRNPLTFAVDGASLVADGPLEARKPATSKMIWAFYYLWYSMDDWDSPFLKDRPAMPYASDEPDALVRHVDQAKAAGIDGFVASWWGPNNPIDYSFAKLLDIAAQRRFWIVAYFETLKEPNLPRPEPEITLWLEYLLRKHSAHPAYYRLNGRPVVVIWASGAVPLTAWQRILTELRSKGLDAIYLGMGLTAADALFVFDGLHDYGVAGQFRLGALYQCAAQQIRGYSLLCSDAPTPKIFAATLQPGYDDRNLPDREGFYWDRRNGDSYRYTFEAAMKSDPDWLFITTWNEWWEHTYIEPSAQYGDLYLQLTKQCAETWKKRL